MCQSGKPHLHKKLPPPRARAVCEPSQAKAGLYGALGADNSGLPLAGLPQPPSHPLVHLFRASYLEVIDPILVCVRSTTDARWGEVIRRFSQQVLFRGVALVKRTASSWNGPGSSASLRSHWPHRRNRRVIHPEQLPSLRFASKQTFQGVGAAEFLCVDWFPQRVDPRRWRAYSRFARRRHYVQPGL